MVMFADRRDAGRRLARQLNFLHGRDVVVLGLPRGGVPVAAEVARALAAPLDVIVVRKLGVPFQPELAMGAIGEDGVGLVDAEAVALAGVSEPELDAIQRRERQLLEARVGRLRRGRRRIELDGRSAVIVDDGLATGASARAACQVARQLGAARVLVAVPVGPAATVAELAEADEVACVWTPEPFRAVGAHYRDFSPTSEDDVVLLLEAADQRLRTAGGTRDD
jgi:putative phosphoribosyl transferase